MNNPELFSSLSRLYEKNCRIQKRLDDRFQLYPGWNLIGTNDWSGFRVAGAFGVLRTVGFNNQGMVIAQAGFDFDGDTAVITNSPQGIYQADFQSYGENARKHALRILKTGKFRIELVDKIIELTGVFKHCGITQVRGISADNHLKTDINGGSLPYFRALKMMDELYVAMGFNRGDDGDYYRLL